MTASVASVKERTVDGFGKRLRAIRQRRGLTQEELGRAVDVSNRVIAYYEAADAQPPGALLAELARALRVSADELLGLAPVKDDTPPRTRRLLKRLQKLEDLPASDQRTVVKLLDALHSARATRRRSRASG